MKQKPDYKTIAWTLESYIKDAKTLLACTDAIHYLIEDNWPADARSNTTLYGLKHLVINNDEIMEMLSQGFKIKAIKRLRELTSCTLSEAKRALEDPTVLHAINLRTMEKEAYPCCEHCIPGMCISNKHLTKCPSCSRDDYKNDFVEDKD